MKAIEPGIELGILTGRGLKCGLRKADVVRLFRFDIEHPQLWQPGCLLDGDEKILEHVHAVQLHVLAMRDYFLPVLRVHFADGRHHQAGITALVIGHNIEMASVVINGVLDVLFSL